MPNKPRPPHGVLSVHARAPETAPDAHVHPCIPVRAPLRQCPPPQNDLDSVKAMRALQPRDNTVKYLLEWTDHYWRQPGYQHCCAPHRQWMIDALSPELPTWSMGSDTRTRWNAGQEVRDFIEGLFRCIDICFFFGTLTHPSGNSSLSLANLIVDHRRHKKGPKANKYGTQQLVPCHECRGGRRSQIILYPYTHPRAVNPEYLCEMVETLVHEMIHAYIGLFIDPSHPSNLQPKELLGKTAHGVAFMLLQARITTIIRSWHPDLGTFMSGFDHNERVHFDSWRLDFKGSKPFTLPPDTKFAGFEDEWTYLEDLLLRKAHPPLPAKKTSKNVCRKPKRKVVGTANSTAPSKVAELAETISPKEKSNKLDSQIKLQPKGMAANTRAAKKKALEAQRPPKLGPRAMMMVVQAMTDLRVARPDRSGHASVEHESFRLKTSKSVVADDSGCSTGEEASGCDTV